MRGRIEKYETKAGERLWRIRWDLPPAPDGRRRQRTKRGYRTKREAQAALAEVVNDQANRGRVSTHSRTTLGEYATAWLDGQRNLKPTSVDNLRTSVEVHIVPRLGAKRVQEVSAEDVAWLYAELAERGKRAGVCRTAGVTCAEHGCSPDRHDGLKPKSLSHVHAALRAILAQAVEDGLVPTNVAETKRARSARPRGGSNGTKVTAEQCWTTEQARAFVAATADDRLGPLWALLLGTGLRRGEAIGLRWEHIDLDPGTLRVARSETAVRGKVVESDDTKSPAGIRTILLGDELVAILRAHRKRQAEERLAAGPAWVDSGYVFVDVDGRALHPNKVSTSFTAAADAAGLPRIGAKGLRHTHATMLLRDGVPVPAVGLRLGHANPSITLTTYTHFVPADDALAADATSRVLFAEA